MTAGEDALVGQLARLLEAERDRLGTRRMLELLSLLLGERAQVGDASRYVYEYGRRAGYSLPAYPLDGSGEFREFFAEEGVRNVPEWYERKLGVPPQLYAQLPARTVVAVRDAANRRRAFVLDGVWHSQDAGFAGLAESGLSRTLPPEGLAELLDAVMAYLLGEPVREGPRPGTVRFVSRLF